MPFQATEEQITALFTQTGVTAAVVTLVRDRFSGQPRGFGFVEINNDEEADRAVQGLNGHDFMGRNIVVNEARPPREGGGGGGGRPGGGGGRPGGGFGGVAGVQAVAVVAGQAAEADREAAVAVVVAEAGTATAVIVAAEAAAAAGSRAVSKIFGRKIVRLRGVPWTPRFILRQSNCDKENESSYYLRSFLFS